MQSLRRQSIMPPQAQYGDTQSVHAIDSSLDGQNVIIAKRRVVKVQLKHCLAIDIDIAAFDAHRRSSLLVCASGKVLYLFDLERLTFIQKYGRTNGSIHRENILDCKFDFTATRMVSCGEDKRIVVWNVKEAKSEKILEGHQGKVFHASFTREGENIISCSDDGRVFVWEWKTGAILLSYLRHPAAARTIAFFPDRPDKIVVGRTDGCISVWDLSVRGIVDTIRPDPDWLHDGEEQSLVGWYGIDKHHSGAIMAIAVSPNGRFMASASTDHTTKLWGVVSYMKDVEVVQTDLRDASQKARQLNQYIDVCDEKYNVQIKMKEFAGLRVGEVPIPTGYHADLIFTFRHESTVTCVAFNAASDICITGSMDSTCRLWSCRRGDLLFQINVPAPISSVIANLESDEIFVVCQNRVLIFDHQASPKEDDLPETWRIPAEAFFSGDNTRSKNTPKTGLEDANFDSEEGLDAEMLASRKATMTIFELKQLISHGLVLPSFLDTLLSQFGDIDSERLLYNMKKYKMSPRQLLQLIVNSKFHPRDILVALSGKNLISKLYETASVGNSITPIMVRLGFKAFNENTDKDVKIFLHYRDFNPELYMEQPPTIKGHSRGQEGTSNSFLSMGDDKRGSYDTDEYRRQAMREQMFYSNSLGEKYAGEMQGPKFERHTPTGDLIHFIPSMQLKLLKDLQGHRDVKPIFLRQILVDTPKQPNFSPEYKIRDTTPWVPARGPVSREGVRFNETVTNQRPMPLNSYASYLNRQKGNSRVPAPVPLHGKGEVQGTSSKTIFSPDRYLKTMGMNVKWAMPTAQAKRNQSTNAPSNIMYTGQGEMGIVSGSGLLPGRTGPLVNRLGQGSMMAGHVYTEPIVIKHGGNRGDFNQQFIAGTGINLKESTVDRKAFYPS